VEVYIIQGVVSQWGFITGGFVTDPQQTQHVFQSINKHDGLFLHLSHDVTQFYLETN